ncbi:unnamed protein product [Amoebophrya sp. A25]|nr:unnamed protein product [Amoebophrya sp. A25]|eukprot:GSA25T00020185001.1
MNGTGRRELKEYINDKVRSFPWVQHNIETNPAMKKEVHRMCTQAYAHGKQLRKAEFQTGFFEPFYLAHVENEAHKLGITKTLHYTDKLGNLQCLAFEGEKPQPVPRTEEEMQKLAQVRPELRSFLGQPDASKGPTEVRKILGYAYDTPTQEELRVMQQIMKAPKPYAVDMGVEWLVAACLVPELSVYLAGLLAGSIGKTGEDWVETNWGFVQMLKRAEEQRFEEFKEELGDEYKYDFPLQRINHLCAWFEYVMEIRKYIRKGGSLEDIGDEHPMSQFASMASGNSKTKQGRSGRGQKASVDLPVGPSESCILSMETDWAPIFNCFRAIGDKVKTRTSVNEVADRLKVSLGKLVNAFTVQQTYATSLGQNPNAEKEAEINLKHWIQVMNTELVGLFKLKDSKKMYEEAMEWIYDAWDGDPSMMPTDFMPQANLLKYQLATRQLEERNTFGRLKWLSEKEGRRDTLMTCLPIRGRKLIKEITDAANRWEEELQEWMQEFDELWTVDVVEYFTDTLMEDWDITNYAPNKLEKRTVTITNFLHKEHSQNNYHSATGIRCLQYYNKHTWSAKVKEIHNLLDAFANRLDDASLFDRATTQWLAIKPWVAEGKPPLLTDEELRKVDAKIEDLDEKWKSHKKQVEEQDGAQEVNGDDQVLAALEKGEKQMQKAQKVGAGAQKKLKKKNEKEALIDDFFNPLENGDEEEEEDKQDEGPSTILPEASSARMVLPKKRSRAMSNNTGAGASITSDHETSVSDRGASTSAATARFTASASGTGSTQPTAAAPAAPATWAQGKRDARPRTSTNHRHVSIAELNGRDVDVLALHPPVQTLDSAASSVAAPAAAAASVAAPAVPAASAATPLVGGDFFNPCTSSGVNETSTSYVCKPNADGSRIWHPDQPNAEWVSAHICEFPWMTDDWFQLTSWRHTISQREVVHVADFNLFQCDPIQFPICPEDVQLATNRNPGVEFSEWMTQAMGRRAEVAQSIAVGTFKERKDLQRFASQWRSELFFREWAVQRGIPESDGFDHEWFDVPPIQADSCASQAFEKMFGNYLQRLHWRAHVEEDQFRVLIAGDKKMMQLHGLPKLQDSFLYSQECYDHFQEAFKRRTALLLAAKQRAEKAGGVGENNKPQQEEGVVPSPDAKIRKRDDNLASGLPNPEVGDLYTIQEGSEEAGIDKEAQHGGPTSLEDFNFNQSDVEGQQQQHQQQPIPIIPPAPGGQNPEEGGQQQNEQQPTLLVQPATGGENPEGNQQQLQQPPTSIPASAGKNAQANQQHQNLQADQQGDTDVQKQKGTAAEFGVQEEEGAAGESLVSGNPAGSSLEEDEDAQEDEEEDAEEDEEERSEEKPTKRGRPRKMNKMNKKTATKKTAQAKKKSNSTQGARKKVGPISSKAAAKMW